MNIEYINNGFIVRDTDGYIIAFVDELPEMSKQELIDYANEYISHLTVEPKPLTDTDMLKSIMEVQDELSMSISLNQLQTEYLVCLAEINAESEE